MMSMRLEKLRQVDLNLLITFAAIAEEKSVTAAATFNAAGGSRSPVARLPTWSWFCAQTTSLRGSCPRPRRSSASPLTLPYLPLRGQQLYQLQQEVNQVRHQN